MNKGYPIHTGMFIHFVVDNFVIVHYAFGFREDHDIANRKWIPGMLLQRINPDRCAGVKWCNQLNLYLNISIWGYSNRTPKKSKLKPTGRLIIFRKV